MSKTVLIKSSDPETQGDFIVIDEIAFDEKVHELFEPTASPATEKPKPSAKAVKLAEDNGLDINTITGTGKNGNVTVKDVQDALVESVEFTFDSEETAALAGDAGLTDEQLVEVANSAEDGTITFNLLTEYLDALGE